MVWRRGGREGGAERGEKIRRKEENGGKKGKNESGRKSSSSISWRRLFVYGFPVSLYDRKYGQSCRSIKRIETFLYVFSLINSHFLLFLSYVLLVVRVRKGETAGGRDGFRKSLLFF